MVATKVRSGKCIHCGNQMTFREVANGWAANAPGPLHERCVSDWFKRKSTSRLEVKKHIEMYKGFFNNKGKWITLVAQPLGFQMPSPKTGIRDVDHYDYHNYHGHHNRKPFKKEINPDGSSERGYGEDYGSSWGDPKPLG